MDVLLSNIVLYVLIVVGFITALALFMMMWNSGNRILRVISRIIAYVMMAALMLFILNEYFDVIVSYLAFIGLIILLAMFFGENSKK